MAVAISKLIEQLPTQAGERVHCPHFNYGASALSLAELARKSGKMIVAVVPSTQKAASLERELNFYLAKDKQCPVIHFADWETLPYDSFSPHQDIISERLTCLYRLPNFERGVLIVPVATLMQRMCPKPFIEQGTFLFQKGDTLNLESVRETLDSAGYQCTHQVMEHGEFAIRGSLLDIFPMGSRVPFRIDLFDNEVDTIRTFDPETQRSDEVVNEINLLPAREFPLDENGISQFRRAWRDRFEGVPTQCDVYTDVSQGLLPAGIEYYLPLFFESTALLFDFIPASSLFVQIGEVKEEADNFWQEVNERYEQYGHDIQRPILKPKELYLPPSELFAQFKAYPQWIHPIQPVTEKTSLTICPIPDVTADIKSQTPFIALKAFLETFSGKVLFCAESMGRRESLKSLLNHQSLSTKEIDSWRDFIEGTDNHCLVVAPLEDSWQLSDGSVALIPEASLFGRRVMQHRRRKKTDYDSDLAIKSIAELREGMPVVHFEHGVGRYAGLQLLSYGEQTGEFVTIEYAAGDKLHVPVSNLDLISRYSGADLDHAPLNRLGTDQWQRVKKKATEQARDVAAELLDVYARREAKKGFAYPEPDENYTKFVNAFPFEETPDQLESIEQVVHDLCRARPMDRIICGDVGFGKTEVAMRAAFIAANAGKQVAILVPTTLLAEQHFQTFTDRFADTPIKIEVLSRFRSKKEQETIIQGLESGQIDIVIGTHKLIMQTIPFKDLGLLIVDEEHRFGVRQKEKLKSYRSEVDILTLTATPIPRTLNLSLSGIRDLSIITTPPAKRLSIKTFVREYHMPLIQEAILRELRRGGQVYYLHNDVSTIENTAQLLEDKIPQARIAVAHGQMRERELEAVMSDFYHGRFNVLVCTTIIETGIDIPTANTIIMDRADKLGLAQLHQLRGRVGRSHHQAYAFCLTPSKSKMTSDAKKRLEAIEASEDLGSGFTLATQDLEIRGAGELLGDEQSGNIHAIGFSLYMEILDQAVKTLQQGGEVLLDVPLQKGAEIDLSVSALIPDPFIPDVRMRLMIYKRISHAKTDLGLDELQVEIIDRFGLLPDEVKNLFKIAKLKLWANEIGIETIKLGPKGGKVSFIANPRCEPNKIIQLIQKQPLTYKLQGSQALSVSAELPKPEERFEFVKKLLTLLDR